VAERAGTVAVDLVTTPAVVLGIDAWVEGEAITFSSGSVHVSPRVRRMRFQNASRARSSRRASGLTDILGVRHGMTSDNHSNVGSLTRARNSTLPPCPVAT